MTAGRRQPNQTVQRGEASAISTIPELTLLFPSAGKLIYSDSLPPAEPAASTGTPLTKQQQRTTYLATFLLDSLLFGLQNEEKTGKS